MYIRDFHQTALSDRSLVGGKGASLGELTRAGVNIPPGFTVTTTAFEQFMASIDLDRAIRRLIAALDPNDLPALNASTAAVREQMEKAPLPADVESDIAAAYTTLTNGEYDAPVAVRSSATSEDSAAASFAGLQDTFLWTRGVARVVRSVRACWASLYSSESVSYRLRLRLPEESVSMGVVVQRMVESRCSGVMFTRSPTTGDRSVIAIEGSWGLGSCIVSGAVTPDRFVVSKVTGEISKRTVAHKPVQHLPQYDSSGVHTAAVPADQQSAPCLTDEEIKGLAETGKQIERHYGTPQDVEWALGGEARTLYILQSRPETVWASRETQPVATPKARAFDHVFTLLSGRDRPP